MFRRHDNKELLRRLDLAIAEKQRHSQQLTRELERLRDAREVLADGQLLIPTIRVSPGRELKRLLPLVLKDGPLPVPDIVSALQALGFEHPATRQHLVNMCGAGKVIERVDRGVYGLKR